MAMDPNAEDTNDDEDEEDEEKAETNVDRGPKAKGKGKGKGKKGKEKARRDMYKKFDGTALMAIGNFDLNTHLRSNCSILV